jgi:hypothetical protein
MNNMPPRFIVAKAATGGGAGRLMFVRIEKIFLFL